MKHRYLCGQSLVEYALVLALVALVAIVILGVVGWTVQGVTGLVVGGISGPGKSVASGSSLAILSARCQPGVKFEVQLYRGPGVALTDLALRHDAPDWYWGIDEVPTSDLIVAAIPGLSCPRSVVVQHRKNGSIAAAGVEQVVFP